MYSCDDFTVEHFLVLSPADDQTGSSAPIVGVVACDSFAEIREQCAWLGGLIGFPVLGGLPDTYAMMVTGVKDFKDLILTDQLVRLLLFREMLLLLTGFCQQPTRKH